MMIPGFLALPELVRTRVGFPAALGPPPQGGGLSFFPLHPCEVTRLFSQPVFSLVSLQSCLAHCQLARLPAALFLLCVKAFAQGCLGGSVVKCLTLDFGSVQDLMVCEFEPRSGSVPTVWSLLGILTLLLSFSKINK